MRYLRFVMIALLGVALLAFVAEACSSGQGGGKTPQAGDTPQAQESPEVDGGGAVADGDAGEAVVPGGFVADLVEATSDVPYGSLPWLAEDAADGWGAKLTYRVTIDGGSEAFDGEWVHLKDSSGLRIEMASMEVGQQTRTIIIIQPDGTAYVCSSGSDGDTCLATTEDAAKAEATPLGLLYYLPIEIYNNRDSVGVVEESQREIAGWSASCFNVTSELAGLGNGEICFAHTPEGGGPGGPVLFLRSEVDGVSYNIEATEVMSTYQNVTAEDFEPPYEVIELPEADIPTAPLRRAAGTPAGAG